MKKLSIIGVLVGGIADTVGTSILALPLMIYVLAGLHFVGPPNQLQASVTTAMHGSIFLTAAQWLVGCAGSVLGGYVAAWIAKHDEVLNATLSSYLCIGIGIFAWVGATSATSPVEHLAALVASPIFAAAGGHLRLARKRSKPQHAAAG